MEFGSLCFLLIGLEVFLFLLNFILEFEFKFLVLGCLCGLQITKNLEFLDHAHTLQAARITRLKVCITIAARLKIVSKTRHIIFIIKAPVSKEGREVKMISRNSIFENQDLFVR